MLVAGEPVPENHPALYHLDGLSPEETRTRIAMIADQVPSGQLSVSVGDVLCSDGMFTLYRASAVDGMAGGAVRSLDRPALLCAVHLAGSTEPGKAWKDIVSTVIVVSKARRSYTITVLSDQPDPQGSH